MPEKVSQGQSLGKGPLRVARNANRIMEATEDYHRRFALGRPGERGKYALNTDRVGIKNVSGGDLTRGNVVQLGDSVLTSVGQQLWLEADLPASSDPQERYAILTESIPDGSIRELSGQVSGVCYALVDVTDADHTRATPANNDPILQSAATGPVEILYKPSGTGDAKECIVRLVGVPPASAALPQVCEVTAAADLTFAGNVINFDTVVIEQGTAVEDDIGNYGIKINETGLYAFSFHASIAEIGGTNPMAWASGPTPGTFYSSTGATLVANEAKPISLYEYFEVPGGGTGNTYKITAVSTGSGTPLITNAVFSIYRVGDLD